MEYETTELCRANLDKRIFVDDVPNTLTHREFFREFELEFGLTKAGLDSMTDQQLNDYYYSIFELYEEVRLANMRLLSD